MIQYRVIIWLQVPSAHFTVTGNKWTNSQNVPTGNIWHFFFSGRAYLQNHRGPSSFNKTSPIFTNMKIFRRLWHPSPVCCRLSSLWTTSVLHPLSPDWPPSVSGGQFPVCSLVSSCVSCTEPSLRPGALPLCCHVFWNPLLILLSQQITWSSGLSRYFGQCRLIHLPFCHSDTHSLLCETSQTSRCQSACPARLISDHCHWPSVALTVRLPAVRIICAREKIGS